MLPLTFAMRLHPQVTRFLRGAENVHGPVEFGHKYCPMLYRGPERDTLGANSFFSAWSPSFGASNSDVVVAASVNSVR